MPWVSTFPKASDSTLIALNSLPPLALPSSGSCGRRRAPSQPSPKGSPRNRQISWGWVWAPAGSILVREELRHERLEVMDAVLTLGREAAAVVRLRSQAA